jgi:hypothetical protein
MDGTSPEMNLEKMTEEAFALLHDAEVEEETVVPPVMNPIYTPQPG